MTEFGQYHIIFIYIVLINKLKRSSKNGSPCITPESQRNAQGITYLLKYFCDFILLYLKWLGNQCKERHHKQFLLSYHQICNFHGDFFIN